MDLATADLVDGSRADDFWNLYVDAFAPLRSRAAQRHVLTRAEFDDVMTDRRVIKHLLTDENQGGRPAGIGTLTNQLDAVPLIAPEYYAERWPDAYAQQRIWYVGFLAVGPAYHGTRSFPLLIGSLCATMPPEGALMAADICQFNEETLQLPQTFQKVAGSVGREPLLHRLDAQTFWAYEFAALA